MKHGNPQLTEQHVETVLVENTPKGRQFYIQGTVQIELRTVEETGSLTLLDSTIVPLYATDEDAIEALKDGDISSGDAYYSWRQEVFKKAVEYEGYRGETQRDVETIRWSDIPAVGENDYWLGGIVHDRQPNSDDVISELSALEWMNNALDEEEEYSDADDFIRTRTFYFFDSDNGKIVSVSSFTPTNVDPDISPAGATVVLQGMSEERPRSSKRTRKKWLSTNLVMTAEGWYEIEAGREHPYRLVVVDDTGTTIDDHNLEAVKHPVFLWVKSPAW